jgi:hypothetical protein
LLQNFFEIAPKKKNLIFLARFCIFIIVKLEKWHGFGAVKLIANARMTVALPVEI